MTYPTDLLTVNAFIISSGGTGGHATMLSALNELCTMQSVAHDHVTNLPALNALAVGLGATGGYVSNLAALNAISVAIGGTGGYHTTLAAWTEIAGLGFGYTPSQDVELDIYLSSRSGNTLTDSVSSLNATILPAVFNGNGSGYYQRTSTNLWSSDNFTIDFEIELNSVTTATAFLGQGDTSYFRWQSSNSRWFLQLYDGTNVRSITVLNDALPLQNRKYSFRIIHNKTGTTKLYEGGTEVGSTSGTFTNCSNGVNYFGCRTGGTEIMRSTSSLISSKVYSDATQSTLVASYVFTGDATCFDVSGANKNLSPISIVAANKSYSVNGSLYCFDSGYTIWEKAGSADIIAPYGVTTSPIATGYTVARVFPGSATKLNFSDALIGFNETADDDTKLNIFDRSNETIQTAASRASAYYASTNLATKSRYHTSELAPYEKLLSWYNTDYQDRVFGNLSKLTTDFSLTEILVSSAKKTGSTLAKVKTYCHADGIYYVGSTNSFRTINRAIGLSYDDYTLNIGTGTYNEAINSTTYRLNFVGSGTRETILFRQIAAQDSVVAYNFTKNATFTNIILNKRETYFGVHKRMIKADGCDLTFTNCKVGIFYATDEWNGRYPLQAVNGSNIVMNNCDIESVNSTGVGCDVTIEDTSTFAFNGQKFQCRLNLKGASVGTVVCTENWVSSTADSGLLIEDDSELDFTITDREVYINKATNEERPAGTASGNARVFTGNATAIMRGNGYTSGAAVRGAGNHITWKDLTVTWGHFWCIMDAAAATSEVIFDNCHIKMDFADDSTGSHIIEDQVGCPVIVRNGSVIEFMGHDGTYDVMGQPITMVGKLTILDSEVIDHANDNVPFGDNYAATLQVHEQLEIRRSRIAVVNWDGVGTNKPIQIQKTGTDPVQVVLEDVILDQDNVNKPPIFFADDTADLGAGDYVCVDNVTNNSSAFIFGANTGDAAAAWTLLTSQCPF